MDHRTITTTIADTLNIVFAQGDGMPLLESDEESISGRLASQLLRRVSEDRSNADSSSGRGRRLGTDSDPVHGAHGGGGSHVGSTGGGGWLPLPRFWPHSSEAADDSGGPGGDASPSSRGGLRPVPPAWRTANLTGFAASGLRSHPIMGQPHSKAQGSFQP